MTNLTDAQVRLLAAVAREGDAGAPQPSGSAQTVEALIKRGYIVSLPRADAPSQLLITSAGSEALAASTADKPAPPQEAAADPLPKGKIGIVVGLLRAPGGATVNEIMLATGWQAHSVRGAIAGSIKKTLKFEVLSEKAESGRTYRIPARADA